MFHRSEAAGFALHIQTAARKDLRQARVVEVVQAHPMPGEAQFGHQINAADAGTDDGDGRRHAIAPA